MSCEVKNWLIGLNLLEFFACVFFEILEKLRDKVLRERR